MYSGWELTPNSVTQIKNLYKPTHPDFIGHHITYMFGKDCVLPPECDIYLIGLCVTDNVECFVAQVNDTLVRPDSKIYHLTWSIDRSLGATPAKSNDALIQFGFKELKNRIQIYGTPKIFK